MMFTIVEGSLHQLKIEQIRVGKVVYCNLLKEEIIITHDY